MKTLTEIYKSLKEEKKPLNIDYKKVSTNLFTTFVQEYQHRIKRHFPKNLKEDIHAANGSMLINFGEKFMLEVHFIPNSNCVIINMDVHPEFKNKERILQLVITNEHQDLESLFKTFNRDNVIVLTDAELRSGQYKKNVMSYMLTSLYMSINENKNSFINFIKEQPFHINPTGYFTGSLLKSILQGL